jgi:hypothetical protein
MLLFATFTVNVAPVPLKFSTTLFKNVLFVTVIKYCPVTPEPVLNQRLEATASYKLLETTILNFVTAPLLIFKKDGC